MLKHAIASFVVFVGLASASVAHADAVGPVSEPSPTPTAPGGVYAKGTLGFSFPLTLITSVAGANFGGEPISTIDLIKFLSDKAALDLIVGLNIHKTQTFSGTPPVAADATVFGFALGAGYRMYKHKDSLHTYIEPQGVLTWGNTSVSESLALDVSAVFGVERQIVEWMSFGGSVGAGLNLTNSFKDIQFATRATLAVNLYWK